VANARLCVSASGTAYCGEGHGCDIHSLGARRCRNGAASQRRICIFSGWGNVLTQAPLKHRQRTHSSQPLTPLSFTLCFFFCGCISLCVDYTHTHTHTLALSFQNWPSRSRSSFHIVKALVNLSEHKTLQSLHNSGRNYPPYFYFNVRATGVRSHLLPAISSSLKHLVMMLDTQTGFLLSYYLLNYYFNVLS